MKRRLEDDILRTDGIEQSLFHASHIHTNQLLIQGDWKRRFATKLSHFRPLMLFDRLFYRMNVVFSQSLQLTHRILRQEATISIYTQLYLLLGIHITDALDEIKFLEEINGTNLQFHAMETRLEFLLQSRQHLFIGSHPNQSVDCDAFFTSSERRFEEIDKILHSHRNRDSCLLQYFDRSLSFRQIHCPQLLLRCIKKRSKGCFETESNARISTNHIIRDASHLLYHLTNLPQGHLIFRFGIATEIRERSTLSHSLYPRHFIRSEGEIITVSRGINPTRRACRLLKVERALRDFYFIHFY